MFLFEIVKFSNLRIFWLNEIFCGSSEEFSFIYLGLWSCCSGCSACRGTEASRPSTDWACSGLWTVVCSIGRFNQPTGKFNLDLF